MLGSDENGSDDIAENRSENVKHESETRRPWYLRKRDLTPSVPPKMSSAAHNIKIGPGALDIAKYENGTRCPRFHRKRVRERKT
jgi:hypothetical protein